MIVKKTDIGVVAFFYAICLSFFVMTMQLKASARIYPLFIIVVLASLTAMYTVQMIVKAKKEGVTSGLEDFKEFMPRQFFPVLAMMIGYLAAMHFVGFWVSTPVFMLACLFYLKVKTWQALLATGGIVGLVYCAFSLFLHVRLPMGTLIK